MFELVSRTPQRRWTDHALRRWVLLRALCVAAAIGVAFVDGMALFLSPGQVMASAFGSSAAQSAADPRWGVFLGLVFWASLAFVATLVRARLPDVSAIEPPAA